MSTISSKNRGMYMKVKVLLCIAFCLLLVSPLQAKRELSIYEALQMAEKLGVTDFSAAVKMNDWWIVKGVNLENQGDAELHIQRFTGIIQYAMNVTPKDLVIGENTYGFSGVIYPYTNKFYHTGVVVDGLKIYYNDLPYYRMKNAIFIQNLEGFVAYFMYQGPGVTK